MLIMQLVDTDDLAEASSLQVPVTTVKAGSGWGTHAPAGQGVLFDGFMIGLWLQLIH